MCCFGFAQQPDSQSQQGSGKEPQKPADQQQQQQQQQQSQPQEQKKSKFGGLFKKPVTASNSNQSKDTASLGSNGLGDDGMPTQAQMNEPATGADEMKAQALSMQTTDRGEVDQFIQQGNLKSGKS
jgi:hypothetical protein